MSLYVAENHWTIAETNNIEMFMEPQNSCSSNYPYNKYYWNYPCCGQKWEFYLAFITKQTTLILSVDIAI